MPLYEYECKKCRHRFEALVASSKAAVKCPKCGSEGLDKQFSTFSASAGGSTLDLPCAGGSCATGGCSTGACPYAGG